MSMVSVLVLCIYERASGISHEVMRSTNIYVYLGCAGDEHQMEIAWKSPVKVEGECLI